jgi:hypothetical protein
VSTEIPQVGTLVRDQKRKRIGRVMAYQFGILYLRPPQGGQEWEAKPDDVRPADQHEKLSAGVAEANARSRWGL